MSYYIKLTYKTSLFLLALTVFWSGFIYRVYQLNTIGVILSVFLSFISLVIILYLARKYNFLARRQSRLAAFFPANKPQPVTRVQLILALMYFFLWFIILRQLLLSPSFSSIVSPWQAIPASFFVLFFIATIVLLSLVLAGFRHALFLIALHFGLMISIAHFVFPLGFGFDPFIHGATLKRIASDGQILPKPMYYLGQYGLIIVLHKLFFIPLALLNKLLLPAAAVLFLPLAIKETLKQWAKDERVINLTIIIALILPLSIFTISTPQNLAFLFLLLAILLSLACKNWLDLALIYTLALAALIIHPLAGIPALLWCAILTVHHSDIKNFKKSFYRVLLASAIAALPLAFYYFGSGSRELPGAAVNLSLKGLSLFTRPPAFLPNSENIILNTLYFYIFNFKFLFIFLVLAGLAIYQRHSKHLRVFGLFLAMALAMLASYFLTSFLPFHFLINYERADFADRILILASIFFFPIVLAAFYGLAQKLLAGQRSIRVIFLVFIALLISMSLYFSYPRYDNYYNSHSYSLSQSDLNAVAWIEKNASADFIVLANQQVSAAALKKYGFKKYYQSSINNQQPLIFYYPIPTGSPLYQYYLDMVYQAPTRETMTSAMNLAGVSESYFVLNKYWWAFAKVVAEAKLTADSYQAIDKGEIFIFKYTK